MDLSRDEFNVLRKYIHDKCGIYVEDNKDYLIRQRLEPIVKNRQLKSFSELCVLIKGDNKPLEEEIIIAISTNETSFFRDKHPFETISAHILPKLKSMIIKRKAYAEPRKGAKVRIWCVASSTGQEPYSLAFIIKEFVANNPQGITYQDFSILATDINTDVLAQAIQGKYSDFEVKRGLDQTRINKYFDFKNGMYCIKPDIQEILEFKKLNLVQSFVSLGGFDFILCRNVLIYFDDKMKRRIISDIHNILSDEGMLILGASENLYNLSEKFVSNNVNSTVIYSKKPNTSHTTILKK